MPLTDFLPFRLRFRVLSSVEVLLWSLKLTRATAPDSPSFASEHSFTMHLLFLYPQKRKCLLPNTPP